MLKEKDDEIIGKRVRVKECQAAEHGDNVGCVCHLVGKVVEVKKRYKSFFAGTPSYHIKGMSHRVRREEVTLLRDQTTPIDA
jgi:hypothetical protein